MGKSLKGNGHSNYEGDENVYENNVAEDDEDDLADVENMRREYGDEFIDKLERRRKSGWTEWMVNDGVLRHYGGNIKRVKVPDGITEIANGAFATNKYIEEVTLPATVTKLGARAFGWCPNLRKAELGDGVIEIGERAFVDCGYLKKVSLGKNLQKIDRLAFWLCSNLKEISIPKSVKSIGNGAFKDCIRLIYAEIDDAETSIGEYAFRHCGFRHISLGENVTEIGEGAFADGALFKITIPQSVEKIGKNIFEGCEDFFWAQCMAQSKPDGWDNDWNKNSLAENDKRVKVVWNWGFTNGVIPYYDKSKFYIEGNKLIKYKGGEREIIIPDGVYKVDVDTFSDCTEIDKLVIPASVQWFEDGLRYGLTKVKAVHFLGTLKQWKKIYFESDINRIAREIYIGDKRIK